MTLVLAHRGSHDRYRENTLDAFAESLRLGADGVELDVWLTSDGVLAVHHDAEIPGAGAISALTRGELPEHVPSLAEALDVCAGAMVNVEVKCEPASPELGERAAEAVAKLMVERRAGGGGAGAGVVGGGAGAVGRGVGAGDRVVVSSFWPWVLDAFAYAAPAGLDVEIAWVLNTLPAGTDTVDLAVERGYRALHPADAVVGVDLVFTAQGRGLAVRPWVVNDPGRAVVLHDFGVDAIITDDVAAILDALGRN